MSATAQAKAADIAPPEAAASETTPLLANANDVEDASPASSNDEFTGDEMTTGQLLLLCACRIVDPIAFFAVFPYIKAMVQENGKLPEEEVGNYTGLIESLYSIAQMLVLVHWARLADRIGRKKVLIISLLGTAVGPALFGLTTSIPQMAAMRSIAGFFSGSALIIRTMIGDGVPREKQPTAYSWFAFATNMGILIGPIVGGVLVNPAKQFPSLFGHNAFLKANPYALPGFVVGGLSAVCALLVFIFVKETLDVDKVAKPMSEGGDASQQAMTIREMFTNSNVRAALLAYFNASLLGCCFTALLPLVLATSVRLGGLQLGESQIAVFMASQGAAQATWLLAIFPVLQRRWGTKNVLMVCAYAYFAFLPGYPLLNALLRIDTEASIAAFWTLIPVTALIGPGVAMVFTAVQLALNDASPNTQSLGQLNAVALTVAGGMRAVAPALSTVIYAVGIEHQYLWGQFGWLTMVPLVAAFPFIIRGLADSPK